MLIKGGNADNMRLGDTLGDDQFKGYQFDYIISNPPFGIDWEASEKRVKAENEMGEAGRFAPACRQRETDRCCLCSTVWQS